MAADREWSAELPLLDHRAFVNWTDLPGQSTHARRFRLLKVSSGTLNSFRQLEAATLLCPPLLLFAVTGNGQVAEDNGLTQ